MKKPGRNTPVKVKPVEVLGTVEYSPSVAQTPQELVVGAFRFDAIEHDGRRFVGLGVASNVVAVAAMESGAVRAVRDWLSEQLKAIENAEPVDSDRRL